MADWLDETPEEQTAPPALPFSDNLMIWHPERRRYTLTEKAFESYTGINLRSMVNDSLGNVANIVDYYLDNISLKVYNYIYKRRSDFERRCAVLMYSPTARDMLYHCLIEQTVYFVTNGDVSKFSGVNIKSGTYIDHRVLMQTSISPDVVSILKSTPIPELGGVTILYAGVV